MPAVSEAACRYSQGHTCILARSIPVGTGIPILLGPLCIGPYARILLHSTNTAWQDEMKLSGSLAFNCCNTDLMINQHFAYEKVAVRVIRIP